MPFSPPGASDPLVGRLIEGQFRVRRRLGRGAMGAVYEAEQVGGARRYAVKVLSAKVGGAGDLVARFEREARASGLLQHPNIVAVHACGRLDEDLPYLVMELVDGPGLGDVLEGGALAPARALLVARQMLSAVGYAHGLGMVHRDLKPDNVMLARGPGGVEQVKILDFGIVRLVGDAAVEEIGTETLTQTGTVLGTPTYMAPEQALARSLDGRADLYAIGCILFEMLVGRPPFQGADAMAVLKQHVSAPPPRLASAGLKSGHCTDALEELVARSLAKKPGDRFATAGDMIAGIDAAFESLTP